MVIIEADANHVPKVYGIETGIVVANNSVFIDHINNTPQIRIDITPAMNSALAPIIMTPLPYVTTSTPRSYS